VIYERVLREAEKWIDEQAKNNNEFMQELGFVYRRHKWRNRLVFYRPRLFDDGVFGANRRHILGANKLQTID
jgi:hypothetical protein